MRSSLYVPFSLAAASSASSIGLRFLYISVDLEHHLWVLIHRFFETLGRELVKIKNGALSLFQYDIPDRILNAIRLVGKHALCYLPGLEYLAADNAVDGESAYDYHAR